MKSETKAFLAVFLGIVILILTCWIIGQFQPSEFEIQQKEVCRNPTRTVMTIEQISGYGYSYEPLITHSYVSNPVTHEITICPIYKFYFPIIVKNGR